MKPRILTAVVACAAAAVFSALQLGSSEAAPSHSAGHTQKHQHGGPAADRQTRHHRCSPGLHVDWQPAPAVFPRGAKMAVIQGDPSRPDQLFTVRLRLPAGYVLPAHFHPTDENVTVICGRFGVGMGDVFRKRDLTVLRRGGFVTAPADMHHFAGAITRTVVQVHAIGPFQLTYVHPKQALRH